MCLDALLDFINSDMCIVADLVERIWVIAMLEPLFGCLVRRNFVKKCITETYKLGGTRTHSGILLIVLLFLFAYLPQASFFLVSLEKCKKTVWINI